jgi:hypothetical protein
VLHRFGNLLGGILVVLKVLGKILVVSGEVEEAVAAVVEEDAGLLLLLTAADGFVDNATDGVT